jgi:hypothetical protein
MANLFVHLPVDWSLGRRISIGPSAYIPEEDYCPKSEAKQAAAKTSI